MNNKTTLTQLYEWISERRENQIAPTPYQVQLKIEELLETERQQMLSMYNAGGMNLDLDRGHPFPSAEQYYTTHFTPKTNDNGERV